MFNISTKLENQAVLTVKPEFVELLHQRHAVTNDKKYHTKKRKCCYELGYFRKHYVINGLEYR